MFGQSMLDFFLQMHLLSEMSHTDKDDVTTLLTQNHVSPCTKYEKYKCNLSEELIKKAKDELNEKPEWRERDIQALRDMIDSHPGLYT